MLRRTGSMTMVYLISICLYILTLTTKVSGLDCYECNVWKAGFGQFCDNPRIVSDCNACMKTDTVVNIGYYKNKPRESTAFSRVCAKTNVIHFSDECFTYATTDGYSKRCYCTSDLCNESPRTHQFSLVALTCSVVFTVAIRWML